jgi:glycine/D-amino acid oxidase-like deaminating enzyme/nitrite reductase/ring-hydroxylating ferredoxin subunit
MAEASATSESQPESAAFSSMQYNSLWLANAGVRGMRAAAKYGSTQGIQNMHFDTIVVGGGIFGCATAYQLKSAGQRVALVEGRAIGCGTTGHSSAKVSVDQKGIYSNLAQQHNDAFARKYYDFSYHALMTMDTMVRTLNLDCGWDRRSHITWTDREDSVDQIRKEFEVCQRIGIPCELMSDTDLSRELPNVGAKLGVCFPGQAMFNPYQFCVELCKHIDGDGSRVFEDSRVTTVEESSHPHRVLIDALDSSLTADNVVLATHLPILDRSMHFAVFRGSRTHCVAARVRNNPIHNMFINIDEPTRSLRSTLDGSIVCLSGNTCEQGNETETQKLYDDLADWLRRHYDVEEILYKWSAMDYISGDRVPYIGPLHRGVDSIYTGTGFSKWGLTGSIAGAELVAAMIRGDKNPPFLDMVDARRWDLLHQFQAIAAENVHVAGHFIKDKVAAAMTTTPISSLQNGRGGLVSAGDKTVGAYKDDEGKLHVVHPVCTHLGCHLVFNQGDRVWDCPCHGSRFGVDGDVIHGPATKPLTRCQDLEW